MSEFIFMLTREDSTVPDALTCYASVRDLDLRWVGFKDVGLDFAALRELAESIHSDGRKVALEVVSLDVDSEVRSARAALDIGVDLLMGGTHPEAILPLLADTNVLYFPFTGTVVGHPSVLTGSAEDIVTNARDISALRGVHGLDLLAYRFDGENVAQLMADVVRNVGVPVVIAGSIDTAEKILAVRSSGAWAFTVGSAVFDGAFPVAHETRAQIEFVLESIGRKSDQASTSFATNPSIRTTVI